MNKESLLFELGNGENSTVEFKESMPHPQSLAEELVAFANARGGKLYLGVDDEGRVLGIKKEELQGIEEKVMNVCRESVTPPLVPDFKKVNLDGKWLAVVELEEGLEKPYQPHQGKAMVRVGSTKRLASREELGRLFQNARVIHIDDHPIGGSQFSDLDSAAISKYFMDQYDLDWQAEPNPAHFLENACLKVGDRCSLAGLLFFANDKKPFGPLERCLPHAGVQFVVYRDEQLEDIMDRKSFLAPLPRLIDDLMHRMELNWKLPSRIEGLKREEVLFPRRLFREMLANAVVHRDYGIHGSVRVSMFPDRVEVVSPGRLVNSVTIEKMKAGVSVPRNPLLMKFMQHFRFTDQLGRGVPMMIRLSKALPGCGLELEADELEVRLVLKHPRWE